jgi:hypothetical protein
MKKAENKLTFAEAMTMPLGDLARQLGESVKLDVARVEKRDALKSRLPQFAKLYAAIERRYNALLNERAIPPNKLKKDFITENAGGKIPNGVIQMSNVFCTLVLTVDGNGKPLLPETFYDVAKAEWLRDASAVLNHAMETAKKAGADWRFSDDVLELVAALSTPGDAGKTIKELRKRQKGETSSDVELTPEQAAEHFIAAIKKAGEMPAERAANLFRLSLLVSDAWAESGISDDMLNQWTVNIQRGVAPHLEVITSAATEPVAAAA